MTVELLKYLYELYGRYYEWAGNSLPFLAVLISVVSIFLAGTADAGRDNPFGLFCVVALVLGVVAAVFPLVVLLLFIAAVYALGAFSLKNFN
jgi:hypothetical protein